ncbi:MAG: PGF-CTERM sorting domain-containing protein, partial [Candidatus Thermoplasmatota archaeon]|nr:PGF-CTERM sorting domain-containing protein [Candidatus Thermoplasmatota archaeon]
GSDVMFHDADDSGTITSGDMIHINPDYDANDVDIHVRLYSNSSDKYSDENPMLPGFGAAAGIVALLSAALIARRD